jgi:hypothetical protein
MLGEHGLQENIPAARQEFERRTEARRLGTGDEEGLKVLRWGWCLGSGEFRKQMPGKLEGKPGGHQSAARKMIGVQVGSVSFVDEGVGKVLVMRPRAGLNECSMPSPADPC